MYSFVYFFCNAFKDTHTTFLFVFSTLQFSYF
mgnify:CR=1 FL=1